MKGTIEENLDMSDIMEKEHAEYIRKNKKNIKVTPIEESKGIEVLIIKDGGKLEWKKCEHKNWTELQKDGWRFIELLPKGNMVAMCKQGYINNFRNER